MSDDQVLGHSSERDRIPGEPSATFSVPWHWLTWIGLCAALLPVCASAGVWWTGHFLIDHGIVASWSAFQQQLAVGFRATPVRTGVVWLVLVALPILFTHLGLKFADRLDLGPVVHPALDPRIHLDAWMRPIVLLVFYVILTVAYGAILAALTVAGA